MNSHVKIVDAGVTGFDDGLFTFFEVSYFISEDGDGKKHYFYQWQGIIEQDGHRRDIYYFYADEDLLPKMEKAESKEDWNALLHYAVYHKNNLEPIFQDIPFYPFIAYVSNLRFSGKTSYLFMGTKGKYLGKIPLPDPVFMINTEDFASLEEDET